MGGTRLLLKLSPRSWPKAKAEDGVELPQRHEQNERHRKLLQPQRRKLQLRRQPRRRPARELGSLALRKTAITRNWRENSGSESSSIRFPPRLQQGLAFALVREEAVWRVLVGRPEA